MTAFKPVALRGPSVALALMVFLAGCAGNPTVLPTSGVTPAAATAGEPSVLDNLTTAIKSGTSAVTDAIGGEIEQMKANIEAREEAREAGLTPLSGGEQEAIALVRRDLHAVRPTQVKAPGSPANNREDLTVFEQTTVDQIVGKAAANSLGATLGKALERSTTGSLIRGLF